MSEATSSTAKSEATSSTAKSEAKSSTAKSEAKSSTAKSEATSSTAKSEAKKAKGDPRRPEFSPEARARLEWCMSRYPTRQAATLPALHLAQKEFGWLTDEAMLYVAQQLGIPPIEVFETATFYTLYHKQKPGAHCIWMCTNVSCFLNGADGLLEHVEKKLGIKAGQTTPDGKFSLFSVECLANCDKAPTAQVDEDYHDGLTPESMDRLIDALS